MAFDTLNQRRAMLGWGSGCMLPEASGDFDGLDGQMFLALPGQNAIENGEVVEPPAAPSGGHAGPRRKIGIGPR